MALSLELIDILLSYFPPLFAWVLFLTLRRMESCNVICFFSELLRKSTLCLTPDSAPNLLLLHFQYQIWHEDAWHIWSCNWGWEGGGGGFLNRSRALNLAIISGGIGVKILEAVDWLLQVFNQPSHLKSAAGTRISCS